MFIDEAVLHVEGGRGGDGCVSFSREKYRPRGGPDGGDGGDGGDVVLVPTRERSTLSEVHRKRHLQAGQGNRGGPGNRTGARGEDLTVEVPVGTVVYVDDTPRADLTREGQGFIVARGGKGGRGNASLAGTSAGPVPGFAEKGEPGKSRDLRLELKLVADVAIVGFPNAGKSTLISRISNARPKVADYPFTTTEPNLGVVITDDMDYVVTDVPGLVEGAHQGKGMGVRFLRHIERCSVLLYLVDASPYSGRDPGDDLDILERELFSYKSSLEERKRIVAANKMDLLPTGEVPASLKRESSNRGLQLFAISAATGEGLGKLTGDLGKLVMEAAGGAEAAPQVVVYGAEEREQRPRVTRKGDRFVVHYPKIERMVAMTDWSNEESREYLVRRLLGSGVEELLQNRGAVGGDEVEIAGRVFEFMPQKQEGDSG